MKLHENTGASDRRLAIPHSPLTFPPIAISDRASSHAEFWDVRYERETHLFGTQPNAFVASAAEYVPAEADVVELGAGEARNLVYLATRYGHSVTAVDFAPTALDQAQALAAEHGVSLETIEADLRTWTPDRQWDGVLVTFVQLLPHERPRFYQVIQEALRPGGVVIAEWFRPAHLTGDYARIGPSKGDRMVPPDELREHFASLEIVRCEATETTLDEGDKLHGRAGVVRFVARKSRAA